MRLVMLDRQGRPLAYGNWRSDAGIARLSDLRRRRFVPWRQPAA
jgi:hypothetical protein